MAHRIAIIFLLATLLGQLPQNSQQLPITSEPLANNPEHLTWDAYPAHNVPPYRPYSVGETVGVKVPKSIFITPNFNESKCSEGYRYDALTHKCHKVQIQVNQQELVIQQALQLFQLQQEQEQLQQLQQQQQQTDGVEYDYDDEYNSGGDRDDEPYHVPLTLSFSISEPFTGTTAALSSSSTSSATSTTPFRNNGADSDADNKSAASTSTTSHEQNQHYTQTFGPATDTEGSTNLQSTSQTAAATRAPATTLADVVDVVGFPTSLDDDAIATLAISVPLPQRQMTTRSAVSATTEMMPSASISSDSGISHVPDETTMPITTKPTTPLATTTEVDIPTTIVTSTIGTETDDVKTTVIPSASDVLENTIPTTANDHDAMMDIFADADATNENDSEIIEGASKEEVSETGPEHLNDNLLKEDDLIADNIATLPTITTIADHDEADDIATTTMTMENNASQDKDAAATDVIDLPNMSTVSSSDSEAMQMLNDTLLTTEPATIVTPSLDGAVATATTDVVQNNVFVVTPEHTETTPMSPTTTITTVATTKNDEEVTQPLTTTTPMNIKSTATSEMPTTSTLIADQTTATEVDFTEPLTASTSAAIPPTKIPAIPPRNNLIEQLRLINLFSRDQHRVRFPGTASHYQHERPSIFVNRRTNGASTDFRFPSPTTSHVHSQHGQSKIAERAPLFSWLPPNWRTASAGTLAVNASHHLTGSGNNSSGRKALNFWNGMPLIRDPALFSGGAATAAATTGSVVASTDRSMRANSKSPTEHLFRQQHQQQQWHRDAIVPDAVVQPTEGVSSDDDGDNEDVFRVLTTKNTRYHNR